MKDETLIEMEKKFGIEPSEYDRTISIAARISEGKSPKDLPEQMKEYMSRHKCSQNMKLAIAFNIGILVGSGCR